MGYNEQQQALIDAPLTTPVVGVAGAGTGKTTTILARTQRILKEYPTGKVLLITFTRAAANDMQQRLARLISDDDFRRVIVGTFHSVIGNIIRQNAVAIGLEPNFSIIDERSANIMYQTIVENNAEHVEILTKWMVHDGNKKLTKVNYKTMANVLSTLVNTSEPEELMTGQFSSSTLYRLKKVNTLINDENVSHIAAFLHRVFKESLYEGRVTNTVTYDHILFIGYLMVKSNLLETFSQSLVHMIVDEYQDTNLLQDAFVRAVGKSNLTIVGDIDQAIYEFRGGRAHLIEDHVKSGQVVNLSHNYRSYQPILDVANTVINTNETGKTIRKPLHAMKQTDESYGGIVYTQAAFDNDESKYIIDRINFLHKQKNVPYSDIAILVRSRTAIASINLALGKSKIPVNDTTKFADFMNSDVMVDTLNFIKIFTNPKDIYAFLGVLDRPKQGIGPKAIEKLTENAKSHRLGLVEYLLSDHTKELTPALKKKVGNFIDVYMEVIEPQERRSFVETVEYILVRTGYIHWLNGLKNADKHSRNLTILRGMLEDFQMEYLTTHKEFTLYDICNAFIFEMTSTIRQEEQEGVCISTIHAAKGLEWPHVIIIGMDDEIFPGRQLIDNDDEESERRLMYVSVTRAKESIVFCHANSRLAMGDTSLTPSRFLSEAQLDVTMEL